MTTLTFATLVAVLVAAVQVSAPPSVSLGDGTNNVVTAYFEIDFSAAHKLCTEIIAKRTRDGSDLPNSQAEYVFRLQVETKEVCQELVSLMNQGNVAAWNAIDQSFNPKKTKALIRLDELSSSGLLDYKASKLGTKLEEYSKYASISIPYREKVAADVQNAFLAGEFKYELRKALQTAHAAMNGKLALGYLEWSDVRVIFLKVAAKADKENLPLGVKDYKDLLSVASSCAMLKKKAVIEIYVPIATHSENPKDTVTKAYFWGFYVCLAVGGLTLQVVGFLVVWAVWKETVARQLRTNAKVQEQLENAKKRQCDLACSLKRVHDMITC